MVSHSKAHDRCRYGPRPLNLSRKPANADRAEYLHQLCAGLAPTPFSFAPASSAICGPGLADRVHSAPSNQNTSSMVYQTQLCVFGKVVRVGPQGPKDLQLSCAQVLDLTASASYKHLLDTAYASLTGKDSVKQPSTIPFPCATLMLFPRMPRFAGDENALL